MLCNRIKQFREYNKLEPTGLAEILDISVELYNEYETGRSSPSMDIIEKLARCYKVTIDEFYGYTPRLTLHTEKQDDFFDENVKETTLKMSDLSWDEAKLILLYRNTPDKEKIVKIISEESDKES